MSAPHSPTQRLAYAPIRALLRTVGRTSDGLALCFDEGLTSGRMLEYVYRNRPSGRLGIGRWIDARFLAARGWQAVRARRALLEALLEHGIAALRAESRPVSLLDVASGPAGYVLAVLARTGEQGVTACCRDLDERWLARGREEAGRLGLAHVAFERGDALDRDALLAVRPAPTLAIASGFYDWITDDAIVRRSMTLIHEVLPPGGRFTLTFQTANPDLAFLSAVFTDFHHAPLQMKMRDASTVHAWLGDAGFHIDETRADARGCYAVTLARRT